MTLRMGTRRIVGALGIDEGRVVLHGILSAVGIDGSGGAAIWIGA